MTAPLQIAAALDLPDIPIELKARYLGAPLDKRIPAAAAHLRSWARRHAEERPCAAPIGIKVAPTTNDELQRIEHDSALATLYLWLNQRWPAIYPDRATAETERSTANALIENTLRRKALIRTCKQCGKRIAASTICQCETNKSPKNH